MTSAKRKLHRPFGALEQRELKRLVQVLGGSAVDVALLVALRVRASADGATSDTLGSLALWAGLGVRTVKDHVAWLEQRGIVRRRLEHAKGGARGQAWRHRIEILRFEDWPGEEQASPAPSSEVEETAAPARSSAEVSAAPAPSSPPEEGAAKDRRGGKRASEEGAARRGITQTSLPDVFPDDVVVAKNDDVAIELAIDELANVVGYELGAEDANALAAFHERRPRVDLVEEIRRWAVKRNGHQAHNDRAALVGWLEKAHDARSEPERYCITPGCRRRGRGESGLCIEHLKASGVLA